MRVLYVPAARDSRGEQKLSCRPYKNSDFCLTIITHHNSINNCQIILTVVLSINIDTYDGRRHRL